MLCAYNVYLYTREVCPDIHNMLVFLMRFLQDQTPKNIEVIKT